MNSKPDIIYIISLPRSGSTLLQRALLSSKKTFSLPETWFLLGINSIEKNNTGLLEWGFKANKNAVNSFYKNKNYSKQDIFNEKISLYKKLLSKTDTKTFIEKTPRNILLIDEIISSLDKYQNDKIIILNRGAEEIFKSYCNYFDSFPFLKSFKYYKEIINYKNLITNYIKNNKSSDKIFIINYEELVLNDEEKLKKLSSFLGFKIDLNNLGVLNIKKGVIFHGDKKGLNTDSIYENKKKFSFTSKYYELLFLKKIKLNNFYLLPIIFLSFLIYKLNPLGLKVLWKNKEFIH